MKTMVVAICHFSERLAARPAGALLACIALLVGCSDSPTGTVGLNEEGGISLSSPEFLQGRAIVQRNLTPRVSVIANGTTYGAVQTNSSTSPWLGQVFVQEGSNPMVSVTWVETQVDGLPAEFNGELPLALFTGSVDNISGNQTLEITTADYITQSSEANPQPQLDIDNDGASNIEERIAGSRPGDALDLPSTVTILYNNTGPIIDGAYDSLWNTAQFLDNDGADLAIDKLLVDNGIVDTALGSDFKWAAMHDGQYLYLMVFGEKRGNQTPQADSGVLVYEDDSVDIYVDSNNSKGTSYDGVDDFHFIVALQTDSGEANQSSLPDARIQIGDRSAPITAGSITYAVCLCPDDQQIYEIRLDLNAFSIPVDTTFGLEVNVNNDIDGIARDTKWAWFNDTGVDDTWRFPIRMGNVRLEAVPN